MVQVGIFKKAVLNNLVNWKNGELTVIGVPGFITPTFTHIELIHSLKEKYKGTKNILYRVGERQTILAVEYAMKKFGFKKSKIQITNSILEQSALLGLGNLKIVKANFKTGYATFKNGNNPLAKHYKFLKGIQKKGVDDYLSGAMAGVMKVLSGKLVKSEETKCIAKGDSCCIFEVKPINKKQLTQSEPESVSKSVKEHQNELKKEKKIYTKAKF